FPPRRARGSRWSAARLARARQSAPATRAPAAHCCAAPRSWHEEIAGNDFGWQQPPGARRTPPWDSRAGAMARRARLGGGRNRLQAPGARAIRTPRSARCATRQSRHRVGTAAARAECVVDARFRRERRTHEAAHVDTPATGDPPRLAMKRARQSPQDGAPRSFRWRAYFAFGLLTAAAVGLTWRAVNLQLVDHSFLAGQGDARFSRVVSIAAHRGVITDRSGE